MNQVLLEWIGYTASLIVLVSLLMSSIKKLRWINLFGALIFGAWIHDWIYANRINEPRDSRN